MVQAKYEVLPLIHASTLRTQVEFTQLFSVTKQLLTAMPRVFCASAEGVPLELGTGAGDQKKLE